MVNISIHIANYPQLAHLPLICLQLTYYVLTCLYDWKGYMGLLGWKI
jgi:hypothetical protein